MYPAVSDVASAGGGSRGQDLEFEVGEEIVLRMITSANDETSTGVVRGRGPAKSLTLVVNLPNLGDCECLGVSTANTNDKPSGRALAPK